MDERFTAYYDKHLPGCARFLWDTVVQWAKERPPAKAGGLYMHHAFFRVRKTPTRAAIRAKGARRIKPHSKAWMATPMKAVSGAL